MLRLLPNQPAATLPLEKIGCKRGSLHESEVYVR